MLSWVYLMNYSETRSYIERQLVKLGWNVRLEKAGYRKIYEFTGGSEERLGQLYYKLVGMGSQQPERQVTDRTVDAAIADLKRMEQIMDKAKADGGAKAEGGARPKSRAELERISIDQLAKELEAEVAMDEEDARLAAGKTRAAETAQGIATPAQGAAALPSSLPRILVVDDSPTIRVAVTKALKNDFSFVQAADGEAAWNLLKSDDSIQLVVTDLIMPKLDGYELIKRIRADRTSLRIAEMPVIVVTTLEETNAKLRALVAGANDFVTKTTDAVELKMRVVARYQVAKSAQALGKEQAAIRKANATPARAPQSPTSATPGGHGTAPRPPQTPMAATQGANAAPARAPQSPTPAAPGASATLARAHQAPTPAMARNTAGASSARPTGGSPGTVVQSVDARRATFETRPPISPAAIPKATSSLREASAARGLSPLVSVIDAWNGVRGRLAKANPLTATTIGATLLIVLVVGVIFFINRSHRVASPPTAVIPETQTLATSQGSSDASSTPQPAAAELEQTPARSEVTTKAEEQSPVRESNRRSTEATATAASAASRSRTPGKSEPGKTRVDKQSAETRAPETTDAAQKPEPAAGDNAVRMPAAASAHANPIAAAGSVAVAPTVATAAVPEPDPEPAVAAAPAAAAVRAPPPSNAITQADLTKLVKKFEFVYEAGDIEQFLGLFGDTVETNDTFTKADLRRDYEDLFKTTEWRVMSLPNVTWDMHDNQADGWGNFEVKVRKVGAKEVNNYKGSLTFHVEKIGGRLYIKRLYHGQWREG